jgi:hypothetical protein
MKSSCGRFFVFRKEPSAEPRAPPPTAPPPTAPVVPVPVEVPVPVVPVPVVASVLVGPGREGESAGRADARRG